MRALAVLLVLLFHAKFIAGGFIGVDIFYVISGFLITGLLLSELKSSGRISLKAFYLRRSKRLLPASFLTLFITALVAWLLLPPISRGSIGRDLIATSLYISNYLFAWWQNDYQNLNATPSPFIHYWSLAVEEQFYLFWPLIILALAKLKSSRKFSQGFARISLLSFLLGAWLTGVLPIWAFYSLPTRAWELGIGALLASISAARLQNKGVAYFGVLALTISVIWFSDQTPFPGLYALLPVLGTAALLASIGEWPRFLSRLATTKIATWLGKISYPLYLWHWPILVLPIARFARDLTAIERLVALGVALLLADLTNRFIEEPLRIRTIAPKKIIVAILIAMTSSGVIGLGIASATSSAVSVSGKELTLASIKAQPDIYHDGCHLNFREEVSPTCAFGELTAQKTVVLYGDSHAAQWFPALQKLAVKKGFRLISLTKSSCPSIEVIRESIGAFQMSSCTNWRKNSITRISAIKPDLLILASYEHYLPQNDPKQVASWWATGSKRSYDLLHPLAKELVYLLDTPEPNRDIPDCLGTTSARKCFAIANRGLPQVGKFQVIDPTPWLCSATCPAIVAGNVAYRDASHLSVATAIQLADQLWQALVGAGFSL